MPVAKRLAKRNRAVKAVVPEVNDLEAVGRAVPEVNDLEAVGQVVPVGVAPVGVAPVGVAPVAPVADVTTAHPTSRRMNFPRRSCASTVRPRWSRAAAVLASVPQDRGDKKGVGMGWGGESGRRLPRKAWRTPHPLVDVTLLAQQSHEVLSRYDGAKVLLRPASPGTGIIAGKTVRAVCELVGVRNMLSKSLGSNNPVNVAKATLKGLLELRDRREVMKSRGKAEEPAIAEA